MKKIKGAALILTVFILFAGCGNASKEISEKTLTDTKASQTEITTEEADSSGSETQNTKKK